MELVLERLERDNVSTIGKLTGLGEYCTLEDKDRGLTQGMSASDIGKIKIPCLTAIPTGRYQVIINFSDRFKRLMPLLLNVPCYEGARIHWGNWSKDTDGCILLGETQGKDFIGHSVDAFNIFFTKLEEILKTEKVYITIK